MIIQKQKIQPCVKDGDRRRFVLLYQGGLANVFEVDCFNLSDFGRNARRVLQADFRSCEWCAFGMGQAGAIVMTMACNQAGDVRQAKWTDDLESQPFSDKFNPVAFVIGGLEEVKQ